MDDLAKTTLIGFAKLIGGMALVLFVGAGTLDFWQAWVYLLVFGASMALITVYLWLKDPALLARRNRIGPGAESDRRQRRIQIFASIASVAILLCPALDHRFFAPAVPLPVVIAANGLVVLGFFVVFRVFRENTFTAGTIEVAPGQQVVDTGPYALVRHPMYAGSLIMLYGTPLALGSWSGLLAFVPLVLAIGWRLIAEEQFLTHHLPGYEAYCRKVRYRLVPFVW